MENPYRLARSQLKLTQEDLATLAGVSRGYITSLESGVFNSPSPRVWEVLAPAFAAMTNYPTAPVATKVLKTYHSWQKQERGRIKPDITRTVADFLREDPFELLLWWKRNHPAVARINKHPHAIFRTLVSRSPALVRYCKIIKIQPTIIQSFELDGTRFPPLLESALLDCGVELDQQSRITEKFRDISELSQ